MIQNPRPMKKPARILILDGDHRSRDMMCDHLQNAEFLAIPASNGEQALQIIAEQQVQVALIDLVLPGSLQGVDVAAECARLAPTLKVLMLTSTPSIDSVVEVLRLGVMDYLTKPINPEILVEKISRAVEMHRLETDRALMRRNYETLFEAIPGVVWFMSDSGRFTRFNEKGARNLGYDVEELVGQDHRILEASTVRTGVDVGWVFKERRTGKRATRRRLVDLKTKSGETRRFEITSSGAYNAAQGDTPPSMGTFGVGWDITEQSMLENQLLHAQKLEAMGRIASGIAHDFNNLLTIINANASLLRSLLPPNESTVEMVQDIRDAGRRAASLTSQLLTFGRQQHLVLKPEPVAKLASSVTKLLRRVISPNIEISLKIENPADSARVDSGQITQVLLNLVLNACDASPDGGTIEIRVSHVEILDNASGHAQGLSAGPHVRFEVQDFGIGMSEEVRSQVFVPFFTTKAPGTGTGLGLSVAYGIIKRHRGHIEVVSTPGEGTVFTILLPCSPEIPRELTPTYGSLRHGGATILLCEDDAMVRRAIKRSLEQQHYLVVEACDGQEALLMVEDLLDRIDVLASDVMMPRLGGLSLAQRLTALKPDLDVILFSGRAQHDALEGATLPENWIFMPKPLHIGALFDNISRLISRVKTRP